MSVHSTGMVKYISPANHNFLGEIKLNHQAKMILMAIIADRGSMN